MVQWLKSPEGIATIGALAYALVCWVAARFPDSPFWAAVRSFATDYKHLNAKALPAKITADVALVGGVPALVELSVDGKRVAVLPVTPRAPDAVKP